VQFKQTLGDVDSGAPVVVPSQYRAAQQQQCANRGGTGGNHLIEDMAGTVRLNYPPHAVPVEEVRRLIGALEKSKTEDQALLQLRTLECYVIPGTPGTHS
jgi:hypothetical protein